MGDGRLSLGGESCRGNCEIDVCEILYRDYLIRDSSYEHRAGQWVPRAFVYEPSERGTTEYPPIVPLPEGVTFSSDEEAMEYSFGMALRFVDGRWTDGC